MSPSNSNHADRGYIIPIGGAEEKFHNPEILDRFIDICGGKEARIGIIPTASELEDTGRNYEKLFREIGVKHAMVLPFETREDCDTPEYLEYIEKSDGVFLTGGNQLRLSTTLGGTATAQLIRRRNAAGMHVAGTSAGAAFVPEHMIAGGLEGSTPMPDMVTMAPGLDVEVVGSGGITIIDPSELSYSSMYKARRGEPVSLIGVRLHILVAGGRYKTASREAAPE
jgi:cyanophycinase